MSCTTVRWKRHELTPKITSCINCVQELQEQRSNGKHDDVSLNIKPIITHNSIVTRNEFGYFVWTCIRCVP